MHELTCQTNVPDDVSTGTATDPTAIRHAAMNLLAHREHSRYELRTKLRRRFADAALVEEQLSRLAAEGLQADTRFAESYARQRSERGYGPVRVRAELRERGVSTEEVAGALEALAIDWCAVATTVLRKKFGASAVTDIKEQARRARFMHYRGFTKEHFSDEVAVHP